MARRMTTEEYKERVATLVGNEYTVLGEYTTAREKTLIRHNKCGFSYEVRPDDFRRGRRCPKCAYEIRKAKRSKTTEEFKLEVFSLVGDNYSVLGNYTNWETKIKIRHNECGNIYEVQPNAFLQGRRCPKCQHEVEVQKRTKSDEDFKKDLQDKFGNEYTPLERYINRTTKIKVKHNLCGSEWRVRPGNLLFGYGCPRCRQSRGEKLTEKVLQDLSLDYVTAQTFPDLKRSRLLSYDFYVPSKQTLIEYQGIQHYEPVSIFGGKQQFRLQKIHDDMKRRYANEKGYFLIEIPYTECTYEQVYEFINNNIS